jgi:hypothetical protein
VGFDHFNKTGGSKMAEATYEFTWRPNFVCIATYKTLEGDDTMDQFEERNIPFDKAAEVAMKELRYYPKTTTNDHILDVIFHEIARKFVTLVVKNYPVKTEKDELNFEEIVEAISGIFRDGEKTIKDLAATTDELIKFADENQRE